MKEKLKIKIHINKTKSKIWRKGTKKRFSGEN